MPKFTLLIKNYWVRLIAVGLVTLAGGFFFSASGFFNYLSIPYVAILIAAIWKIINDQLVHDRALRLKQTENTFGLSVTSHIAGVVFDKLAAFSEEYAHIVNEALADLFKEGPTRQSIVWWQKLAGVRHKHAPWIPEEITHKLIKFEDEFRKIGADAMFTDAMRNNVQSDRDQEVFTQRINSMFKRFEEITGSNLVNEGDLRPKNISENVLIVLQSILGIPELTALRMKAIKDALSVNNE